MQRRAGGRAAGAAAALAVLAALAAPAAAHGPAGAGEPAAVLDPLAPELAGVRVQLRRTMAPQLAVENPTAAPLLVLDARGVPFLRIGPGGVEGNLESPAWYRSFAPPGGARVPPDVVKRASAGEPAAARWVRARREPAWGWFDPRLEPGGEPDGEGERRWEIAVRIGEQESALRGRFAVPPPPRGAPRARLSSSGQLAAGVRVSLLPGRAAAFFLQSDSAETLTVLGRDGEPFLRLDPSGVAANLRSATFAEVARLRGGASLALDPRADGAPRWQRLSAAPRYSWVDPRTALDGGGGPAPVAAAGAPAEPLRWAVPVQIGAGADARTVRIEGVTVWEPFPDEHEPKPASGG